jgi:hypothetical protein
MGVGFVMLLVAKIGEGATNEVEKLLETLLYTQS